MLGELGRLRAGVADEHADRGDAVLVRPRAGASGVRIDRGDDLAAERAHAFLHRIETAENAGARGAIVLRHDAIRDCLRQRLQQHVDDARRGLGDAAHHRGRVGAVEHRAFRTDDLDRSIAALVDRYQRIGDRLHGEPGAVAQHRERAVYAAAHLRGRAGVVEHHAAAVDRDLHLHRDQVLRPAFRTDRLEEVVACVDAVGDFLDACAREPFGIVERSRHRVGERCLAVLARHLDQALAAHERTGILRLDIERAVVGVARVVHDHAEDVVDRLVVAEQEHRRDADAFRVHVPRGHGKRARRDAADVNPMTARHCEGDDIAVDEHRARKLHVGLVVAAAEIDVVGDDDVARLQVLHADRLDRGLGRHHRRAHHRRDVVALGDELHLGIEDRGGGIAARMDDRACRRAHHGDLHLARRRIEA